MYKVNLERELDNVVDGDKLAGMNYVKPDEKEQRAKVSGRAVLAVLRLLKLSADNTEASFVDKRALQSMEAVIMKACATGCIYVPGRDIISINAEVDIQSVEQFLSHTFLEDKLNILKGNNEDGSDDDCLVVVAPSTPLDHEECMVIVANRFPDDYIRVTGFQVRLSADEDSAYVVPWSIYVGFSKFNNGGMEIVSLSVWDSEHLLGNGFVENVKAKDEQNYLAHLSVLLLYYVDKNWREEAKYGDGMQYLIIAGQAINDRLLEIQNEDQGTLH